MVPDKFVSRRAWGSSGDTTSPSSHPIGSTVGVTLHYEGPRLGGFPHSACARKVRAIERFHKISRGWADIAYNAIVCPHGYVFEGRGPGVRSAANGYASVNDDWYAVCSLSGQGDPFTDEAKAGFKQAILWLRTEGNAGPRVNGHRDHKPTACPGDRIYKWLRAEDFSELEGFTDMDIEKIATAILKARIPMVGATAKAKATRSVEMAIAMAVNRSGEARQSAAEAKALAEQNAKAIDAMSTGLAPEVREAVKAVLSEKIVITFKEDS